VSKEETKDLLKFLKPYPQEVSEMALWLRDFIWDLYPECNELIYDNYNALAFGWSLTDKLGDTFCSIAVLSKYVHFGFFWGAKIPDPEKILLGKGNQYRYIIVKNKNDFPETYIKKRLLDAYAYSYSKMKSKESGLKGATIVKSISPIKKRLGVIKGKKKNKKLQ
jgi:hypothetical protein